MKMNFKATTPCLTLTLTVTLGQGILIDICLVD